MHHLRIIGPRAQLGLGMGQQTGIEINQVPILFAQQRQLPSAMEQAVVHG